MTEQALAPIAATLPEAVEEALVNGNLAQLTPEHRVVLYKQTCDSLGLNPLTTPFQYITLNSKLVLYATRNCTDQLRKVHNVNVTITSRARQDDIYVVTARAQLPNGRTDEEIGAVSVLGLKAEALANAMMKAGTKAKRRVTLSIVGLSMLDETEVETIPGAKIFTEALVSSVTDPPAGAGASAGPPAVALAVAPDGAAPADPPSDARPIPFPEQPPAGEPARITAFYELTREGWRMNRAETRERLGFPYADLSDAEAVKAALDRLGLPHDNAGLKDLYERASQHAPAPVTA